MPSSSPDLRFSFSRWFKIFGRQKSEEDDAKDSTPVECYACTQVGLPVFHSTTCDQVHQPQWEASAGSSLVPIRARAPNRTTKIPRTSGPFGPVLDPRSKRVQRWNRAFLLARGMALAVDPLFFYSLSIGRGGSPCLYMDGGLAAVVTVIRTCVDAVHLFHVWLQFRLAYVSRETLVVGCGKLVWDARSIAAHYLRSLKGFWFDAFVILPVPQVAGGCWYVLAIQRVASCLRQQCERKASCDLSLSCSEEVCYQLFMSAADTLDNPCGGNSSSVLRNPICLDVNGPFHYGIYKGALPVISSNSVAVKILYPIFWGLMTLSTFGNDLEPTSNWLEVVFSITNVLSGLMLFTLLIGNIQVFLHAVMAKKRKMQIRIRDMEWWMKRRQLPSQLRNRVRHYERQKWSAMGGHDEMEVVKDLPEGLRRDIKRFLCLDLIRKVPLFQSLDDLILDNICDRVKPLVFSKNEKIIREGDPVPRLVFIVKGRVKSTQNLSRGIVATSILEPGGFLGDELLSWCLRRPFIDRLPSSSATFTCLEPTEVFELGANNLRYITDHFRYKFNNERLKRTARFYSSNWRTWAAVNIQLSWRRYIARTRPTVINPVTENGGDRKLLKYAAVFMSLRPHDHLE
ncbi:cyclic nucleotide-gated ion channel 2 isoform X2 [Daucus carota subsp. sativus]|uniref:cyclic nucleotide-gated ion channel 2 isoform X2 n=1 Tax=Daucus carota subsp. sativus TaxID=79200 RepID=UPI0007F01638|nr:PREDICTED: cyclic nucleotide-gated ion channel 2-like isoform X3 [Daucus carota subsp. sativus]